MSTVAELPVVEVKNLSVRFGDFFAVKDVSFTVSRGEIFGFLGANGAGKTTTIRVLCGLLLPSHGQVHVAGADFTDDGGFSLKSKVGYMSQKFTLYDDLTVEENLKFTSQLRKMPRTQFLERKKALLDFIEFDHPLSTLVKDLPGGIKQQVSLAASILHDPEVVFLDEPTAGVTPAYRARFWALIRDLASRGKTVFVTTHYMDEAEQCGRIALMRAGELIALDKPEALKRQAFPQGLIELDPIHPEHHSEIREEARKFSQSDHFALFEPYGMRYHAVWANDDAHPQTRTELEKTFRIKSIPPSLEDVFIRLVEDKKS